MAISEATALARAVQVRRTFPKGRITVAQARAMFMATADSQVGYASGSGQRSLYGKGNNWRTKGTWTRQVYWCALGASWAADWTFGRDAANAGFGWQGPPYNPVGWRATWLWHDWCRRNGRWVGIERAQSGDISLQSWGRTRNSTDHVEIVSGPSRSDSTYPTIGFNTATGNATSGAGVQRARRPRGITVGIYRPDWDALVRVYNSQIEDEDDDLMTDAQYRELNAKLDRMAATLMAHEVDRAGSEKGKVRVDTLLRYGATGSDVRSLETKVSSDVRNVRNDVKGVGEAVKSEIAQLRTDLRGTVPEDNTSDDDLVKRVADEVVKRLFERQSSQGFSFDWWSRLGLVVDPEHRQYPADPGSLADLIIRIAEKVLNEKIEVYDGTQKRPRHSVALDETKE